MSQAHTTPALVPVDSAAGSEARDNTPSRVRSEAGSPMNTIMKHVFHANATKEQAKDTGMAAVLILLLFAAAKHRGVYLTAAIGVHLVNMIAPQVFRPAAVVWFGLSHVMGNVVSKVILALVFYVVVTPIALWRRLNHADSLQLKAFKKGRGSVMQTRNHKFSGKDIEQPY